MRLQQYIKEEITHPEVKKLVKFANDISPWLKYCDNNGIKNRLFWRGTNHFLNNKFQLRKMRKSRNPVDMNEYTHDQFDDAFYNCFGIRARSQSVFCFSRGRRARHYGDHINVVLPKGKFDIIWSPTVKDLYVKRNNFRDKSGNVIEDDVCKRYLKNEKIKQLMDNRIYGGNEIMLHCKEYYLFDQVFAETFFGVDYIQEQY